MVPFPLAGKMGKKVDKISEKRSLGLSQNRKAPIQGEKVDFGQANESEEKEEKNGVRI